MRWSFVCFSTSFACPLWLHACVVFDAKERNHENDKKFLQKVFERIDEDGSGELTLEELVEGARQEGRAGRDRERGMFVGKIWWYMTQ